MIPVDPVDLSDPRPYAALVYYSHVVLGCVGLLAAVMALIFRKGSRAHMYAGRVFSMMTVVICVTSLAMLSVKMAPPLLVAALTAMYAVVTGLLALRQATAGVRRLEYALCGFELAVVGVFLSMAIPQVAAGRIPPIGPAVILAIPLILLAGDINFFLKRAHRQELRVQRHLARMIWAFVISVRAPLAEIYQYLNIPVLVILFGPLVVAPIMIWLFRRRLSRSAGAVA